MDLNDWANAIAVTALVPLGLFIYYYGTEPRPDGRGRRYSRRWRSTSIGKVLMGQKIMWFLFLLFVVQSIFFNYAMEDYVRVVVYSALVIQFWVVFITLRMIQKNPPIRSDDGENGTPDENRERARGVSGGSE